MSLEMLKAGLLTTIQDRGRFGFRKYGIITSGAMDTVALRIANLLTGNQENEAAIEITMAGPKIRFLENHLIAITGADLSPTINQLPVPQWRPVYVSKGSLLDFGTPVNGCRAYLAVAGGLDVPVVMKSQSTYLRAKLGGWHGRALRAGDIIPCLQPGPQSQALIHELSDHARQEAFTQASWTIDPQLQTSYPTKAVVYALKGPEYALFAPDSRFNFWHNLFQISAQSDRMGYRLTGPALATISKEEILSSAVTFGTVQVPPGGNPIVLMADHQTTGGYPRIAQVITAHLSILAQMRPGNSISFREISLTEARQLLFKQEENISQLKKALQIKTAGMIK